MIKKALILFSFVPVVFVTASCSNQPEIPGDINVGTVYIERDRNPGNIMEKGRIDATGR